MLFIAMIEAAALAASSASGERCSFASPTIPAMTLRLREASAVATRVPHRCCSLSSVSITRAARLSRWSLAYSGSFSFKASIDIEILRGGNAARRRRRQHIASEVVLMQDQDDRTPELVVEAAVE